MSPKSNYLNLIGAFLFSILLLVFSVYFLCKEFPVIHLLYSANTDVTKGVIIGRLEKYASEDSVHQYVIQYHVQDTFSLKSQLFWESKEYHIGDSIEIIYVHENPRISRVKVNSELYYNLIIFTSLFVISMISMIIFYLKRQWFMQRTGDTWPYG